MAYVFLGETLEPLQLLGGALVVAAIVLLQIQKERIELAPESVRPRLEAV
jgi:drug/metabolite transporter (DMT)-like permease